MKTELILKFTFEASHSLENYEVPHPHLWKVEVSITGEPVQGKIIDIVLVRESIQKLIDPLNSTYLNDHPGVSDDVRKFPTCETLSLFFCEEFNKILKEEFLATNPSIQLCSVMVALCDMNSIETGAVKLTVP